MKTTTTSALITLALAASFAPAHAQEINLSSLDEEPNRVHFSAGAEYGFVVGVGYSRILPILDRHVVLTGAATLPWASFDLADYRVRDVRDELTEGQQLLVKVLNVEPTGKIRLSRRAVLRDEAGGGSENGQPRSEEEEGDDMGNRQEDRRRDDRGRDDRPRGPRPGGGGSRNRRGGGGGGGNRR